MPCSIWMPPWARGPVFTVSRPRRTGLAWARADRGSAAARAVPTRNLRRSRDRAIAFSFARVLGVTTTWRPSTPAARATSGAADREGRGLLRHPPSHRHVAELSPQAIHVGEDGLVGALDVDRGRRRHPAGPARHPEHLRAI